MVDVHTPKIRSKNMRAIRNQGTAIENKVSKLLRELEIDFREQVRELPGKPDFVIEQSQTAIFVHGCFWHHHDCHLFKIPETRTEFWLEKINKNVNRDQKVIEELRQNHWKIMLIWECALRGRSKLTEVDMKERIEEGIYRIESSCYINTKGIFTL